ncbi:MAG: hypothetical protein IH594_08360, partial [Bacteroidales bacterium]|nr:hypothetical protein [Bacteroidales bacterium]
RKGEVKLEISAEDLTGNPLPLINNTYNLAVRKNLASFDTTFQLKLTNGFYHFQVVACNAKQSDTAYIEIGIVPPQAKGLRTNSFSASNTSVIKRGKELQLLELIGIKVQRTHFYPEIIEIPVFGQNKALEFDFDSLDRIFNETAEKGIWILPIAGYAFPGTRSERARSMNMHGPPRHFGEFTESWKTILEQYPEIRTFELWNEPWIYEWTWAANANEYRDMHQLWCTGVLDQDPGIRIIAGNSCMFVEDHIEPYPEIWKGLIHGTSHHPYANAEARSLRHNAQIRSIDYGFLVNKRMGLPYYYLTEGGTLYKTPASGFNASESFSGDCEYNNNPNATKAVQYSVTAALHGCYQSNIQWNLGYGPGWTRSNTTLAVYNYFTEDKPIAADIWPGNSLITGAVYADPVHIDEMTRSLPRSDELSARWKEPVSADAIHRDLKVAVVYSLSGYSSDSIDINGRLRIVENYKKLRAFDCTGREIIAGEEYLEVPLSEYPVYLVTEDLGVFDFQKLISNGRIDGITAVNIYATSLTMPQDAEQVIHLRVDNHLNHELPGVVGILNLGRSVASSSVSLHPGLNEVFIPAPDLHANENDQIPLKISFQSEGYKYEHLQTIQRAIIARGSRRVDGNLEDWKGVNPVNIDSEALKGGIDLTRYLFNPALEKPVKDLSAASRVAARVYASYDEDFIYFAAEVFEDTLLNNAGKPAFINGIESGYELGMPGGLTHPRYTGDCIMLGFGFRDRVPGKGRQMDDPLAWKGHFYDTDYLYLAYPSDQGDQLIRQWGAETPRLNGFQTDPVEHISSVPGSEIKISRNEDRELSVYEISIPRKEIKLFNDADSTLRFGFIIANNEGAGTSGKLEWSEAAGVFDYWLNTGSFAPTWDQNLPCQTYFGIAK